MPRSKPIPSQALTEAAGRDGGSNSNSTITSTSMSNASHCLGCERIDQSERGGMRRDHPSIHHQSIDRSRLRADAPRRSHIVVFNHPANQLTCCLCAAASQLERAATRPAVSRRVGRSITALSTSIHTRSRMA
jgi:hypothetical protein